MNEKTFKALLLNLPPERILNIPIAEIPPGFPHTELEDLSDAQRQAAEQLLFQAMQTDVSSRTQFYERFSADVVAALEDGRTGSIEPEGRLFAESLRGYTELRKAYQETFNSFAAEQDDVHRRQRLKGQLYVKQQETEKRLGALQLIAQRKEAQAELLLVHLPEDTAQAKVFREAIDQLTRQVQTIAQLISPWWTYRLEDVGTAIAEKKANVLRQERDLALIQHNIDFVEAEIERLSPKQRQNKSDRIRGKQNLLGSLIAERNKNEIFISENALFEWLDIFIEANSNPFSRRRAIEILDQVKRSLYFLLSRYCELQERSAQTVARRVTTSFDTENMVHFLLASEKVVLDYFAKKKKEQSQGISETAKLRRQLVDNLERELLTDLRTNQQQIAKETTKELQDVVGSKLPLPTKTSFWSRFWPWRRPR